VFITAEAKAARVSLRRAVEELDTSLHSAAELLYPTMDQFHAELAAAAQRLDDQVRPRVVVVRPPCLMCEAVACWCSRSAV
jgi:hypothetical protein